MIFCLHLKLLQVWPLIFAWLRFPRFSQAPLNLLPVDHQIKSIMSRCENVIFEENIATGETSQGITSRNFSSLLFTSMSILWL